jgi:hypothetical protein
MPASLSNWQTEALDRLAADPCGYHAGSPPAAEPTALAALALLGAGRVEDARAKLDWLANVQVNDGAVPPLSDLEQPGWPTALCILAANVAAHGENGQASTTNLFDRPHALMWLLGAQGKTLESTPDFGHDGMIVGWPWVVGTHSWQEPTAWSVLALKSLGMNRHPRTREGVRMLVDRLLPKGGCNYGNTYVLHQLLRPHIEPTGITMLALASENIDDPRIIYSLQYLSESLSAETTPISLSYGLLGLIPYNLAPKSAAEWLDAAYQRTIRREASPLNLALLSLAAQGKSCPLVKAAMSQV